MSAAEFRRESPIEAEARQIGTVTRRVDLLGSVPATLPEAREHRARLQSGHLRRTVEADDRDLVRHPDDVDVTSLTELADRPARGTSAPRAGSPLRTPRASTTTRSHRRKCFADRNWAQTSHRDIRGVSYRAKTREA